MYIPGLYSDGSRVQLLLLVGPVVSLNGSSGGIPSKVETRVGLVDFLDTPAPPVTRSPQPGATPEAGSFIRLGKLIDLVDKAIKTFQTVFLQFSDGLADEYTFKSHLSKMYMQEACPPTQAQITALLPMSSRELGLHSGNDGNLVQRIC